MAALTFYGLKTCDTCRKAAKALEAAGHDLTVVDVRADGVSEKRLAQWAQTADWEKLLNKASTTWRNLPDTEKKDLDRRKALALLAAHPTLIKRPVIEKGDALHVGWSPATKKALL